MKILFLILTLLLAAGITASAAGSNGLFIQTDGSLNTTSGFIGGTESGVGSLTQLIADDNPAGTWNSIAVSGVGDALNGISVSLSITGGNNSGLYAYLTYDGTLAVLLNRPGVTATTPFGDTGAGLTETLTGTALYSGVSPLSSYTAFTAPAAGSSTSLNDASLFGNLNPNGTWTLFVADVSGGGGNATLNGWSLNIVTVPEPSSAALLGVGVFMIGLSLGCACRRSSGATCQSCLESKI